jgi:hypothetical protein
VTSDYQPTAVAGRLRLTRQPVDRLRLAPGDRVKFRGEKQRYTVRAVSTDGRWVICTKPFNLRRTVIYTVIDFDSGVRGPDNCLGLGYETEDQIAAAMVKFEAGDAEVSVRYDAYLDVESVERAPF